MSVFDERQEDLEKYETMWGVPRGRLAVTLDLLTDALSLVGQHGVYCQSNRYPNRPALDVELIMKLLNDSKAVVSSVMEELKNKPQTNADKR